MTPTRFRAAVVLATAVLIATGCGAGGASPSEPTRSLEVVQTPDLTPDIPPSTTSGSPAPILLPAEIVEPILDDAAARSGVARDQLVVARAEPVTWPDGGLGCPEPGMMYIQVLVDGYWVVVQTGKQELDYRGSERGVFRLCPQPAEQRRGPADPGGGGGAT